MPQLAACFALVRPVGMTEDAATEWLAVAAHELAGYKQWMVESGLKAARKTSTHHGQIIPKAIEHMRTLDPWQPLEQRNPRADLIAPPPEIQGLIDTAAKKLTA